jgi:asparagine synthase (glutamine-hydrolysing)
MCGIAGWIGIPDPVPDLADRLIAALRHRGPDATGRETWPGAGLIHTRLSIIDLSPSGRQPMSNEDGSVWIVFNGEIYNHHELRADLTRRGHRFRGTADSEVLPHLYEEEGDRLFERLRGMFSVGLIDLRRRVLLLGRDRFGIKPLFLARAGDGLAFASEIRALREVPGVDWGIDRQAVSDFAALSYVPAPLTLFRGVRCVEPGEVIRAEWGAGPVTWSARRHHRFRLAPDARITMQEAVERVEGLLERGVRAQLESDVPLGALLSGGIDSSLVCRAAQKWLPGGLKTFNVEFPDRDFDETWAAAAVARSIGSTHRTLPMPADAGTWEAVTGLLMHCGQPFADTSMFAVRAVCNEMRRHLSVALSGDGGDEGFGGYYFHWMIERVAAWLRIPAPGLALLASVARLPARMGLVSPGFPDRLRGYRGASDAEVVRSLTTWIEESEHRRLCRDPGVLPVTRHFTRQWDHELGPGAERVDALSALATEVNVRLIQPNDFLFKTDIASMSVALELRVPMLDEDLFAFALTLPRQLKVHGSTGKLVLRRIAEGWLPKEVARKPKMGFGVPLDRWVDEDFRNRLGRLLLGPECVLPEYFEPKVYRPWIEGFSRDGAAPGMSREALQYRVIMLLALQLAVAPVTARS